ncbi:histidine phosphatase family protein [Micromonospora sp. 4G57]|uniref:Histidine phosphatase family protein n=1 Tax=Micromonospora sicca TaxID=2202420 RepID=A0ABU5JN27_9ACTN|nr:MULTISPECIES: histidine phosphatase family protein [unclassified Micromonospora]MDZ5446498.1 histidine phosphatase family protein [Micromonospora sp. 4G57]MDZ5494023.1 histidine phosphatase family protein [Micromonospora sp. 4G53]
MPTVARIYLVQHAEKLPDAGDPGLTALGRSQAAVTGRWLSHAGLGAVYTSPLLRARQTAQCVAGAAGGLSVHIDHRLRERMNWDGNQPIPEFLQDWSRATLDREFVPRSGDSSRQAAQRMMSFLAERAHGPVPIAVVTHGGITVDVLRTLLGDEGVATELMTRGVPSCAITTLDSLKVVSIAWTDHLPADSELLGAVDPRRPPASA